jgi:type II secretory pathway pseudopilin PulG
MQSPTMQSRKPQAGITLTELLIAMIIMTVISTMLVGGWISLQRSFAFTSAANTARATARDALDRTASEIRAAQPSPLPNPTSTAPSTPFVTGTSPYVCDGYACTFYSAYNNSAAADGSGGAQQRLTAIWLDTLAPGAQKTLYWRRDTAPPYGQLTSADRTVVLATNVVNSDASLNRPVFVYNLRDASGGYSQVPTTPGGVGLTSANVFTLASVQVEIIVDANLAHTPTHIDLRTTVQPRNQKSTS